MIIKNNVFIIDKLGISLLIPAAEIFAHFPVQVVVLLELNDPVSVPT